jgi:hypothetical protein
LLWRTATEIQRWERTKQQTACKDTAFINIMQSVAGIFINNQSRTEVFTMSAIMSAKAISCCHYGMSFQHLCCHRSLCLCLTKHTDSSRAVLLSASLQQNIHSSYWGSHTSCEQYEGSSLHNFLHPCYFISLRFKYYNQKFIL